MKRITCFLLVLTMLVSMISTQVLATEISANSACGAEGENVTWSFDEETKELTISGEGAIADYPYNEESECSTAPWAEYADVMLSVVIEEGVTEIGEDAFYGCSVLGKIQLPVSLEKIGKDAFSGCEALTTVDYTGAAGQWADVAIEEGNDTFTNLDVNYAIVQEAVSINECLHSIEAYSPMNSYVHKVSCSSCGKYLRDENHCFDNAGRCVFCDYVCPHSFSDGMCVICNIKSYDEATASSGSCGDNVTWTLDGNGVLTISGSGEMGHYSETSVPWFEYRNNIRTVYINVGVTTITDNLFYDCTNLTSVSLPESIITIGDNVFVNCSNLTNIILPNSLTQIGLFAFQNCSSLKSITIPASVVEIRNNIFMGCSNLTEINVASENPSFVSINGLLYTRDDPNIDTDPCLYSCPGGLSGSITIASGVKRIILSAFSGCAKLTNVVIPDGVTKIGSYAFIDCSNLLSITIPESVTAIEHGAFRGCTQLREILFPSGIKEIEYLLCEGCTNLTTVSFPSSITSISQAVFEGCDALKTLIFTGNAPKFHNHAFDGVIATAYYPANDDSWTEEVRQNYGGTITWVAAGSQESDIVASGKCGDNATWILTGDGTLTISGTGSMYASTLGEPIAATYKDQIKCIVVEAGITNIGTYAFNGYSSLERTSIPSSVRSIEKGAFYDCGKLTNISIEEGVTNISEFAFSGCKSLESIDFPDSLAILGESAFMHCESLTSVVIPAGVGSIGISPFAFCISLQSIVVEEANTKYASENGALLNKAKTVLSSCAAGILGPYTVPNTVTTIESQAFAGCSSLTSVSIPDTVTSIGSSAFTECVGLTEVNIPNHLTVLNDAVFSRCSNLKKITIPSSVTSIGNYAFAECEDLTEVWFQGDAPTFSSNVFGDSIGPQVVANAYYPSKNATWTEDVLQNYGGTITWVISGSSLGETDYISLLPVNGATDVGYSVANPPVVELEFAKEIVKETTSKYAFAELDFTSGSLKIFRKDNDTLVYEVAQNEGVNSLYDVDGTFSFEAKVINDKTLKIDFTNPHTVLEPGTEYYITVDAGFIKFMDGTTCSAIEKGEWVFRTLPITGGVFKYNSAHTNQMAEYTFEFDESWLFESSDIPSIELARMSIRIAMSAAAKKSDYIEELFGTLGFDDSTAAINYPNPTDTTIGYAINSKRIYAEDGTAYTLVLCAVRGGGYGAEWADNFNVGTSGNHQGFSNQASKVVSAIDTYIEDREVQDGIDRSKLKIWITGYSRAAAVSNIAAHTLNDKYGASSVYAYCFECPQGVYRPDSIALDTNVFNIVNDIDLVPYVAPSNSGWNFGRYGITYYVPSAKVTSNYLDIKTLMSKEYAQIYNAAMDGKTDIEYFISPEKTGQSAWLDDLFNRIAKEMSSSRAEISLLPLIRGVIISKIDDKVIDKGQLLLDILSLLPPVVKSLTECFWNSGGNLEITAEMMEDLFASHYPELCLAWMDCISSFDIFSQSQKYRKVYIKCPVDIRVYDSANNLVAAIIGDEAQEIEGSSIGAYIDSDGQKVFILPNDEEYRIEVTVTGEGVMTYTATEYDSSSGTTEKIVSYYEVPISAGDKLTGIAENLSLEDGEYPLITLSGNLTPNIDQSGSAVKSFSVTATAEGSGEVEGSGEYLNGTHATVYAFPDSGSTFDGWFVDGQLVSEESTYRTLVSRNISISAKFANDSEDTPHTHTGGTATCTQKAICSSCGEAYGDYAEHDYESAWSQGDANGHWHKCKNCDAHDTQVVHTPGADATVTTAQTCTVCGYVIKAATGSPTTETTQPEEDDEPIKYKISSGKNRTWRKGSDYGLSITVDAPQDDFVRVLVDGKVLSSAYYTVSSDTTITLKTSYLESLPRDKYTIRIEFEDGYAETTFTVANAIMEGMPFTGDNFNLAFWLGVNITSGLSLLAILVVFLRKRYLYRQTQE